MLRLGIVDFDSSHAVEFTKRFNHVGVDSDQCVEGARVVIGSPGTSTMSPERIGPHTEQLRAMDVTVVEDATAMLGEIDAALILSLCGKVHLEKAEPFLRAGLPTFIDKPFTCSTDDARQLFQLAAETGAPLFSASALRYSEDILEFQAGNERFGPLCGAISYGPALHLEGNPGLFHYGIHPTELLFALMGPGCRELTNQYTDAAEVVTGRWDDDRLGSLRGSRRGATQYGAIAFCERAVVPLSVSSRYAYRNLCREIVRTFESGQAPLSPEQMLETVSFLEAAGESQTLGGHMVHLN